MDQSETMVNEPILFRRDTADTAPAGRLLYPPESIVSVQDSTLQTTYEEGRDYVWNAGTRTLTLPEGSRIPFREEAAFYPAPDAPEAIAAAVGAHQGDWLLFGEGGNVFCDFQVAVTYRHTRDPKEVISLNPERVLQKSVDRLKSDKPFKVVLLGDSISVGGNSSGYLKRPPHMPAYGQLVVDGLKRAYGREVDFVNISKGGVTSSYGVEMIPEVVREQPDLLIIAFGMNDASLQVPDTQYAEAIGRIMRETLHAAPQTEIVLVATMIANPEWSGSNPSAYKAYLTKLHSLKKKNTVVADLTTLWNQLLKRKSYWDITANGVNHPNDFGHRLYAQAILASLLPTTQQGTP